MDLFSPEELNNLIKLVLNLSLLILGTSVGIFTRELIFPKDNSFKENVGLSLVAGIIAFGVSIRFPNITLEYGFLLCFILGFMLPLFKDWMKDKTLFRIFFRAVKKTSDLKDNLIEEIDKEINKEEK